MSYITPVLVLYISQYDHITSTEGEHIVYRAYSETNAEKARNAKRLGQIYITRGIYGQSHLVKVNDIDITPDCITYYVENV